MKALRSVWIALGALVLFSCGGEPAETPPAPLTAAEALVLALDHPDRPDADRVDDEARKPADVLAFAGVEPGMRIFEMEAGRGYYTELLSRMVGPVGAVTMQNPAIFDSFAGEAITARLKGKRLANVTLSKSNFDELDAADASVDMVTWILGPHELYYTPVGVETLGDERGAYEEIMRILKPGGYFIVLDHAARAGTPKTSGGDLHRIDPSIVKYNAGSVGFELVDQSGVLRNLDDNYDLVVFDPSVRRKTDRFLIKFRKPVPRG